MSEANGNGAHAADFTFSTVRSYKDDFPADTTFSEFMAGIRDGKWRALIQPLRAIHAEATAKAKADGLTGKEFDDFVSNAIRPLKMRLPGACFSGTFSYRDAAHLIKPSGLICADLDHLNERVEPVRELVAADPHVMSAGISPSGTGLKVVFRIDPARPHIESFHATETYVRERFNEHIDPACKDVNRLCFVTWDPDVFIADHAEIIPYPPPPEPTPTPPPEYAPSQVRRNSSAGYISVLDDYNSRDDFMGELRADGWTAHNDNTHYWCRPGVTDHHGATWDMVSAHPRKFHVFTSSVPSIPVGNWSPVAVYAWLRCGGNDPTAFARAEEELYWKGYGTRTRRIPKAEQSRLDAETARQQAALDAQNEATQSTDSAIKQKPNSSTQTPTDQAEAVKSVIEEWKERRAGFGRKILPRQPVVFLRGIPVLSRGNIGLATSLQKSGKTAVGGAIAAATAKIGNGGDTLGFTAENPLAQAVIVLDSEQSAEDHEQSFNVTLKRAGIDKSPAWLYSYGVKGLSVAELKTKLRKLLIETSAIHSGVLLVILDGVAEFVIDTNDPKECNPFVTQLEALTIEFNCHILCVLHLNPSPAGNPTKSRGHLGSQLERKCETDLRLVKDPDGVTTVFTSCARHEQIFEKDGIRFSWETNAGMHTSLSETKASVRGSAERELLSDMAGDVFGDRSAMRYGELISALKNAFKSSESAAERKFREMKKHGVIEHFPPNLWTKVV